VSGQALHRALQRNPAWATGCAKQTKHTARRSEPESDATQQICPPDGTGAVMWLAAAVRAASEAAIGGEFSPKEAAHTARWL
jgi:hypothetical protein